MDSIDKIRKEMNISGDTEIFRSPSWEQIECLLAEVDRLKAENERVNGGLVAAMNGCYGEWAKEQG